MGGHAGSNGQGYSSISKGPAARPATVPKRYPVSVCGVSFVGLTCVFCCRRRVVCFVFRAFLCFFEGVPASGDHFLGSEGAGGWPWRLGDDFVMIFDGFRHPFGTSPGALWKAFGRQKLQMGGLEACC